MSQMWNSERYFRNSLVAKRATQGVIMGRPLRLWVAFGDRLWTALQLIGQMSDELGRLICPEGRVSSLNKSNPIQSDEPWKFFGYTDIGSKNVVDGNLRFFCYTCTNNIFATNLGIDLKFCNQIWYHWFQLPILICTWLMKKYSQETHISCRCLNLSCCCKQNEQSSASPGGQWMPGLDISQIFYLLDFQNYACLCFPCLEYTRKIYSNPLARLIALLAQGCREMRYVEPRILLW